MPEAPTHLAAIALGSNLPSRFGSPRDTLTEAFAQLASLGTLRAVSRLYTTDPVGYTAQPRFTNAAVLLETTLAPHSLLESLLALERRMGRDRSASAIHKGPRILDLDLLLFEDIILNTPTLQLPHPELAHRRFVLEPLADIAADIVDPRTHLTIRELLNRLAR